MMSQLIATSPMIFPGRQYDISIVDQVQCGRSSSYVAVDVVCHKVRYIVYRARPSKNTLLRGGIVCWGVILRWHKFSQGRHIVKVAVQVSPAEARIDRSITYLTFNQVVP